MHTSPVIGKNHLEKLYNSKNPFVRYVFLKRLRLVLSLLPHQANLRILDAGCGEGHLLHFIEIDRRGKKDELYGVDVNPVALAQCGIRVRNAKIKLENVCATGFESGFFDVSICIDVLEHIRDYKKALSELKRITKPRGLIIVGFPNELNWTMARLFLRRKPIKVPDHLHSLSPKLMDYHMGLRHNKIISIPACRLNVLTLYNIVGYKKE